MSGTIPETVVFMFQMTFAIITPALIAGAYPERINFPVVILFSAAWLILVYAPVAHWIWSGGGLAEMGVMDFAGGSGLAEGMTTSGQLWVQVVGVVVVAVWSVIATFVIVKLVGPVVPLRVNEDEEIEGIDINSHGECAYEL